MRSRKTRTLVALGMVSALAFSACGNDEETTETAAAETAAAETAAPAETTAAETAAAETAAAETAAPAETAAAETAAAETVAAAAGGRVAAGSLKDVCPDKVVIQTDWNPESEHGALYQMVGAGYTVDDGKKSVTGPLFDGDVDTGGADRGPRRWPRHELPVAHCGDVLNP